MTAPTVRGAMPADAAAIAGVHVRAWQAAYRGLVPDAILDGMSVRERESTWRELLARDGGQSFTLVAERAGELLGFCSIATPSRDDDAGARTGEIAAIYVEPDAWRTGIGAALLDAALATLHDDGWDAVSLWVFAANEAARGFYARFGFEPDGAQLVHEPSGQIEVRLRRRRAD